MRHFKEKQIGTYNWSSLQAGKSKGTRVTEHIALPVILYNILFRVGSDLSWFRYIQRHDTTQGSFVTYASVLIKHLRCRNFLNIPHIMLLLTSSFSLLETGALKWKLASFVAVTTSALGTKSLCRLSSNILTSLFQVS